MENDNCKIKKILIGILLLVPIYIILIPIVAQILNKFNFVYDSLSLIIFPIVMYLPIIVGIFMIRNLNVKDKSTLGLMITLLVLAICSYFITYFVDAQLEYFFSWLMNTIIYRIIAIFFYKNLVGWKKTLSLLPISFVIILLSVTMGFWA